MGRSGVRKGTRDLSKGDRELVLLRDRERCLRCGRRPATLQHRRAKGFGGLGSKGDRLTPADALALCAECNARMESDLQDEGIRCGWKISRFSATPAHEIPYFDRMTGSWWLPNKEGRRKWVDPGWAMERVALAMAA
jgi:DNA-directed RNA polymerase subunit RPC12/RpoP